MSFLPGQLELSVQNGEYVVTVRGKVVMRNRSQKAAVNRFNTIRKSMESEFPQRQLSDEEIKAVLASKLNDVAIDETLKRPPRKRSTARSSRTFGG
jgi:hypothetical protein